MCTGGGSYQPEDILQKMAGINISSYQDLYLTNVLEIAPGLNQHTVVQLNLKSTIVY